jgi:ubiquinone/menaquinone biosynthesis C-methylase UbiE
MKNKNDTSWQKVASWYDASVGDQGHYYHQHVVIPNLLKMLDLKNKPLKVLDIGCGQGVLSRHLPKETLYTGIDFSKSLVQKANQQKIRKTDCFIHQDATEEFDLDEKDFSHAFIILALQNMEHPLAVFKNAFKHLKENGKLYIVLNHPSFRIPRQSSWEIDEKQKIQFRRVNRYLSPLKIPLQMHPGKDSSITTWSFHFPLSAYSKMLKEAGFKILDIDEWISDKVSVGKAAKMENRAREEFPLFMAIEVQKSLA